MKFSEMIYVRPDAEKVKASLKELTEKLRAAQNYAEARAVFFEKEASEKEVMSMSELAMIRHSIDTRDEFYGKEIEFWNAFGPEVPE